MCTQVSDMCTQVSDMSASIYVFTCRSNVRFGRSIVLQESVPDIAVLAFLHASLPYCRLPFVEQIFYDNSHKPRSISHKCIKTLDKLVELGESVTDKQLQEAKSNVKPEFVLQNLQTSVNS